MNDSVMRSEFPGDNQRAAVCYRQWRGKDRKNEALFAQAPVPWYAVENRGNQTEFRIYDDVGGGFFGEGVTADRFLKELDSVPEGRPIVVGINSRGGSVTEGLAIYNALKRRGNVTTRCDGMAASIASVILMAGDRIRCVKNGTVMLHDPSAMVSGGSEDMRRMADRLDAAKNQLAAAYVERTKLPLAEVDALMSEETWMDATEARDLGFVDELEGEGASAQTFDLGIYNRAPDPGGSTAANEPAGSTSNPPPVMNNRDKHQMNTLIAKLADCGLVPEGVTEESALTKAVAAWVNANKQTLADMTNRIDALTQEVNERLKNEAETYVDSQIQAGRLKKDRRTELVSAYCANPEAVRSLVESIADAGAVRASAGSPPPPAAPLRDGSRYPFTEKMKSLRVGERSQYMRDHWADLQKEGELMAAEKQS